MLAACAAPLPSTAPTQETTPAAPSLTGPTQNAITALIEEARIRYAIPGVAVAIVKDGGVVYSQGFGVRDVTTTAPVTPETPFPAGSIVKSMTALAIGQLVDQGRLNLDDPVRHYVPDLRLADETAAAQLTLRQLLNQTSGLTEGSWSEGFPQNRAALLKLVKSTTLAARPGEQFQYANLNYALAGAVVEAVSGQPWVDYVEANILMPLGMAQSGLSFQDLAAQDSSARLYSLDVRAGLRPLAFDDANLLGFNGPLPLGPSGGLYTSANDLARYALLHLGAPGVTPLVRPETLAELHRPQTPTGGTIPSSILGDSHYALGWDVEQYNGMKIVHHGGFLPGAMAHVLLVPEEQLGVVVLTNSDAFPTAFFKLGVSLQIVDVLTDKAATVQPLTTLETESGIDPTVFYAAVDAARTFQAAPEDLEAVSGTYESAEVGAFSVTLNEHTLVLEVPAAQIRWELLPYDERRFLAAGPNGDGKLVMIADTPDGNLQLSINGQIIGERVRR